MQTYRLVVTRSCRALGQLASFLFGTTPAPWSRDGRADRRQGDH